jgi:hypothetical protein
MKKIFIFVLSLFFTCSVTFGDESTEKVYNWFRYQQDTNRFLLFFSNGLVPSYEGGEDCFTYDEALSVFVFTLFGEQKRAEKILKFYDGVYRKQKARFGKFMGFTDVYKRNGRETETRAAGPNAWILMAINFYTYQTDDSQFLDLAKTIADWLIDIEGIEGGITGGFFGNGEPMAWISSEHNFDCFSAFRDLYILTRDEKYGRAAARTKAWLLKGGWNEKEKRFNMGSFNPNYATDLSSWAVLSLGTEFASTLSFAIDKAFNKQYYKINNVEIEGFDFGSPYIKSPYPDKDAVWFEGTAHMVLAFYLAEQQKEGDYFLAQLEKAITKSKKYKEAAGLPYASNEGTPPYGSWLMEPEPLSVAASAWYLFAKEKFNPFDMTGNLDEAGSMLKVFEKDLEFVFYPIVDDFEYNKTKLLNAYPQNLMITGSSTAQINLSKEAKEGYGALEINIKTAPAGKDFSSSIMRPFLHRQNWSGFEKLTFWIKARESSKGKLKIQVKDKDGELWDSPFVYLKDNWQEIKFDLNRNFKKNKAHLPGYGNNKFDTDSIIAFALTFVSHEADKDTKILIDELKLE